MRKHPVDAEFSVVDIRHFAAPKHPTNECEEWISKDLARAHRYKKEFSGLYFRLKIRCSKFSKKRAILDSSSHQTTQIVVRRFPISWHCFLGFPAGIYGEYSQSSSRAVKLVKTPPLIPGLDVKMKPLCESNSAGSRDDDRVVEDAEFLARILNELEATVPIAEVAMLSAPMTTPSVQRTPTRTVTTQPLKMLFALISGYTS